MRNTKIMFITSISLFVVSLILVIIFYFLLFGSTIYNITKTIFFGSITFVLTTTIDYICNYIGMKKKFCTHYHLLITALDNNMKTSPNKQTYVLLVNKFSCNCYEVAQCSKNTEIAFSGIVNLLLKNIDSIFNDSSPYNHFLAIKYKTDIIINALDGIAAKQVF